MWAILCVPSFKCQDFSLIDSSFPEQWVCVSGTPASPAPLPSKTPQKCPTCAHPMPTVPSVPGMTSQSTMGTTPTRHEKWGKKTGLLPEIPSSACVVAPYRARSAIHARKRSETRSRQIEGESWAGNSPRLRSKHASAIAFQLAVTGEFILLRDY
jgi:hypothetical protein